MSDVRIHPSALKRKALKLFGLGHSAAKIGKEIGVTGPTILRWAKEANIAKGSLEPQLIKSEDDFELPLEGDTASPIVKLIKKQESERAITQTVSKTSTPAEQYQTLVAAKGIEMLQAAFKNPPIVKNLRDLKTLTEIVDGALGLGGKRGGVGGKLAIDLNILTKPQAGTVIEATIVEEKG